MYPEGLLFIIAPIFILLFIYLITDKNNRLFYLFTGIKILAIAIIINPYSFGTSVRHNLKMFTSTLGVATIGWEYIRNASPMEMLGFYNINYSNALPKLAGYAAGSIISLIFLLGLLKIKNKLLFFINILIIVSFFILYRYISPNFFAYHRAVTYSLFIFVLLFSVGVAYIFTLFKKKFIKVAILSVFLILSSRSMYRTLFLFYSHYQIIDRHLISLEELNKDEKITQPFYTADVYLGEYDLWKRVWREYFLNNKLIISRQNYPRETKNLSGIKLVLAEKSYLERDGKKIIFTKIIWENQYFKLGGIVPSQVSADLLSY